MMDSAGVKRQNVDLIRRLLWQGKQLTKLEISKRTGLSVATCNTLLNELEKRIGPSFKKTKASIYKKDKNGFYVYAKPNLCDTDAVVKYISRYLGRPVIASSRIDSYDGENVTFHYNKHEDNSYVEKTVPVMDFISLENMTFLTSCYEYNALYICILSSQCHGFFILRVFL